MFIGNSLAQLILGYCVGNPVIDRNSNSTKHIIENNNATGISKVISELSVAVL